MSSPPNQTPSETTALVDTRLAGQSSRNSTKQRPMFSSETLLIPVALATTLANGILSTTAIELTRITVCRFWNASASGPSTPEDCDAPEIAQYFAIVLAILTVTENVICIAGFGMLSRISSQYGRKPAFYLVLIAAIMSNSMIVGSQYMSDWLAHSVFLVGTLFSVFSGLIGYLINMTVVEECTMENRTVALSKIAGWTELGTCISFALGGYITTKTGDPLIVFHMATAIYISSFIYVISVLPESFSKERRNALSRMHPGPSTHEIPATSIAFLNIFEPLKMLIPTRRIDGSRNWRLTWCAAHTFLRMVASFYAVTALMVLVTSKYHLTPEDTGLFFTATSVTSTIYLMVIVPPLLRFLRPYYRHKFARLPRLEEEMINGDEVELETSDRLQVHLAFASCIISAVTILSAAASTTSRGLIICGIFLGFTSMHDPVLRSLVAGSVGPLRQGEALAAFEMVSNMGGILSPIIMGSILTATIETTPLVSFFVHLVVLLASGAVLFLISDADRYQEPHEA